MSPEVVQMVAPMLFLAGVGGIVLAAMKMRYKYLRETRLAPGSAEDVERLTEAMEVIREEVRALREDFTDMAERVEFAERMLTRAKAEKMDRLPGH